MATPQRDRYLRWAIVWFGCGWAVTSFGVLVGAAWPGTLWEVTFLFLSTIGVVVGALGVYQIHRAYFEWVIDRTQDTTIRGAVGFVPFVAGTCLVVAAVWRLDQPIAYSLTSLAVLLGTWCATFGLAAIAAYIRGETRTNTPVEEGRPPMQWLGSGAAMTALGFVLLRSASDVNVALATAIFVVVLGLTMTNLGMMAAAVRSPMAWTWIGLGFIVGGTALVAMSVLIDAGTVATLVAAVITLVGFAPLTRTVPIVAADSRWFGYVTAAVAGAGVAAVVTVTFSRRDWPLLIALLVIALAIAVVLALASDLVELVALLIIGTLVAGVVLDRVDHASNELATGDAPRIVALGDSYMSGEGAERFFPFTNIAGSNECRRTSTAYPYLVAAELGYRLDFVACSGARTVNFDRTAQMPDSPDGVAGGLPQIRAIDTTDGPIAAVLISVAGNDAWFSSVGQACAVTGSCAVHRDLILRRVSDIGDSLVRVYTGVKDVVGDGVPIVAMAYPMVLTEVGCAESPLTADEHGFLFEFTEVLNDRIRRATEQAGVNFYDGTQNAFVGHRLCDDEEGMAVNLVQLRPTEGSLRARFDPLHWVHGTLHPKPLGHTLIADRLTPWLGALIERAEADPTSANPTPNPNAVFRVSGPTATFRVSTLSLDVPEDLACPRAQLPVSGTGQVVRLGIVRFATGLEPGSPVCYSLPDGGWRDDLIADSLGSLRLPTWSAATLEGVEGDVPVQVILTHSQNTAWQVAVLDYCDPDPDCVDSAEEVQAWANAQIGASASAAVIPVGLIFLASWFVAVDLQRRTSAEDSTEPTDEEPTEAG